jgi:uncharacterized protein YlxW (UPF0749 family)
MITSLLVYISILTFTIVYGIHKYEAKIKDYKGSISDYRRALSLSKDNSYSQQHYTQLQLDNSNMRKSLFDLDTANNLLQEQVRQLKVSLAESRRPEFESSIYQSHIWANKQELELDPISDKFGKNA